MKKEQSQPGGSGGMSSSATGGPLLANKDLELNKEKENEDMQFENLLRKFIKNEVIKALNEAQSKDNKI